MPSTSTADTPSPQAGGPKQPRKVFPSETSESKAQSAPTLDNGSGSTDASGISVLNESPPLASKEPGQDIKQSDLREYGEGPQNVTNSPEKIYCNLEPDASSATVVSEPKQTGRTVTTVTTTTTKVEERKNKDVQQTGPSTTVGGGTVQPRSTFSHTTTGQQRYETQSYSQGGLQKKASFYIENHPHTVSSTSTTVEPRRSSVLSRSSGIVIEDSLFEIQHLHRQETDQILIIMKARLKQHQESELVYEQDLEALRTDNDRLTRQVAAATSEITLLKIRLSSHDTSGPASSYDILVSTITTTITTVTTTITTVTNRIEQWIDEVVKNNGKITISKTDLDRLLSSLSDTSSQMTKLQRDYSEMSRDYHSVRRKLEMTSTLCEEKDGTITSLTDEDAAKGRQIIALRKENDLLRRDSSTASSDTKGLRQRLDALEAELADARYELDIKTSSIEDRDRTITSITTRFTQLQQSDADKAKQIAAARQENEKLQRESSIQITDLRNRYDALSNERDSVRDDLRESQNIVKEKDRAIVSLTSEVERLRGGNATTTKQLETERQEKEKLQQDVAARSSQIANLQERCEVQSKEIISLRSDVQAKVAQLAGQEHTITSLTTDIEQARREIGMNDGQTATAREEAGQLRQKLTAAWDEKADLQKRFNAQLMELNNLRDELDRLNTLLQTLGDGAIDGHVADYIRRALDEREKQIQELRRRLDAAESRENDARKAHQESSSKLSALSDDLKVKTSLYDAAKGTIDSLTIQVSQFKATDIEKTEQLATAHNQVQELRLEVTTLTSQITELQSRSTKESQELITVKNQIQTLTSSVEEKTHILSSLTTERNQQAELITKLQRESSTVSSQLTDLQGRHKTQLEQLASVQRELKTSKLSIDEKIRQLASLTDKVAELERTNASKDERIADAGKEVVDVQQKLTDSRSRITKLEHDIQMSVTERDSLRNQLKAIQLGDNATISSLEIQVKEWKEKCTKLGDDLMATSRARDQLRHDLDLSSSRLSELEQKLAFQIKQSQQSNVSITAELTATQKELEQRRHELDTSFSRIAELEKKLASEAERWQRLDASGAKELATVRAEFEQLKHTHAATEVELAAARKRLEELQRNLDTSSSQVTKLGRNCEKHSAELEFLRGQFSVISSDPTVDPNELHVIQTQIMAEVKEYTDVRELAASVDRWMSEDTKRAKALALELEQRNKENEELRQKLITLKDIYVRAPRIKQIFQSETVEIKRRYEEESNALKAALADSQSQLRGVQRIVATADTYADDTITLALKRLNAEVQQNTTYMAEGMAEDFQPRTTKATEEQTSATQKASHYIGETLANCLASMEHDDVMLYLPIAFQAYFSYYLCWAISSWTIEKGHNDFINEIYERLQKSETQPMSGRWRALTRAYISPTWMSKSSSIAQEIMTDLNDILVVARCATSATPANSKLSSFKDKIISIISTAGQFSEMIGKVVSADFTVVAPPPLQVFEEATMEPDVDDYDKDPGKASRKAAGQKVLCSTQLGMTKRMQRESRKETLTVTKAKVVLESFLDG